MARYLVRLDDACPTMNRDKWTRIEVALDKFEIKPMVGIIPKNEDPKMMIERPDDDFWKKTLRWQAKGWEIALHGYNHVYITNEAGLHPVNKKSEFAGVAINLQEEKLKKGYSLLKEYGLEAEYFFAPSHTFDLNTLRALKKVTPINKICDTVAWKPYSKFGFQFYPQQLGHFRNIYLPGVWTFCYHPNTMREGDIEAFEKFIETNRNKFISFKDIVMKGERALTVSEKILAKSYYTFRNLRGFIQNFKKK
ncbi:Polysaccharide deacetylase [compost metagenome]